MKAQACMNSAANCVCQVGSGVVGSASLDPLDDLFGLAKNTSMNTVRFFAHGINSSYALQTAPGASTCRAKHCRVSWKRSIRWTDTWQFVLSRTIIRQQNGKWLASMHAYCSSLICRKLMWSRLAQAYTMKPISRVWTLPWRLQRELMSRSSSQWRTTGEQQ